MRLANGIVIDKEATFGALKFSALRREVHLQNEDGSVSEEIKERTLWTTTSLIFMWTADGTGSRGTGWTVSENR